MRSGMLSLFAVLALTGARPLEEAPAVQDVRFTHVDVYVTPAGAGALTAWQVELTDPSGRAKLVGIEGGEFAPWNDAPHYDPAALQGERIILAAYALDDAVGGRQRVARVHLAVEGAAPINLVVGRSLVAAEQGPQENGSVEVVR